MYSYQYHYHNVIQKDLILCNSITTASKLPMLKKIDIFLGGEKEDDNYIISYLSGLKIISGQTPLLIQDKIRGQYRKRVNKSNRNILGSKVTLRGSRLYSFIYKLLFDVFPSIRQFDGLKLPIHNSVYCFVLKNIFVFEELIPLFPYFKDLSYIQCQLYFNTKNKLDILFLGNSLHLCFIY